MAVQTVDVLRATDRQRAVASLTLAFSSDPVMRWCWPDPERYLTFWPQFAEAFGGPAFDHATAYGLEDCVAIALWHPPGVEPDAEATMALMRESLDDQTFEDVNGIFEQMDRLHPRNDHWYLPLTGVEPRSQGRGLGTSLLRHALKTCDDEGLSAYLEATTERNRDLYARHGFNVVDIMRAGTSPPLWAMLREPAA